MRPFRLILLVWLVVATALAVPPAHAADDSGLEEYLRESFDNSNVPGMAVVATRGGEVVLSDGYGVDGRGDPMTARTPLRAASLTKSITSVAVHQLVEEGLIDLDDPVVEHLPEFRLDDPRHEEITIQQLLDNRSGMSDGQFDLGHLNDSTSLEEYVARLGGADLAADPGEVDAYCNVNWEVLARMVEVTADRAFDEYLDDEVFGPLGMTDSTVDARAVDVPGGYQEIFGFHVPRDDHLLFSADSGSNGLITTADDLGRWTRWVASGAADEEILRPSSRKKIIDRAVEKEGADGFEAYQGRLGKNGMQHTEMSQLWTDPGNETGVTVVVNNSTMDGPALAVSTGALDVLAGGSREPVGSGWWMIAGYYVAALIAVAAGVSGVRRARRWAARRVRRRWMTMLRLLWLPAPTLVLLGLPAFITVLTNGVRTVTWEQLSYLLLNAIVVLTLTAGAGLCVLVARIAALRSHDSDLGVRRQQLGGRETEDRPHRVTEVGR